MTGEVEFQRRIDKMMVDVAKSYMEALKTVEELKQKMNELELGISEKGPAKTTEDMDQLNSEADMLNEFTDSLIMRSVRVWEDCRKLEQDCRASAVEPTELIALRDLCRKMEQLAQDLLCYSLARFKRKASTDSYST